MRQAAQNFEYLFDENEKFFGISLGWDFVAEHEWGIGRIISDYGIDTSKIGYEGRKINKVPNHLYYAKTNDMCVLSSYNYYGRFSTKDISPKDLLPRDLNGFSIGKLKTAWDESGFCIVSDNPMYFKYIDEVYEAIKNKNILITFFKQSGVLGNSSLSLLIVDKLQDAYKDAMYNVDKKRKDLYEYEKKIGVTELKEKNKGRYNEENHFIACSPHWIDYEDEENREKLKKKLKTKYDIQFWINYSDDDDNYGWYIAEDIIKWLSTPGLKLTQISKGGSKKNG